MCDTRAAPGRTAPGRRAAGPGKPVRPDAPCDVKDDRTPTGRLTITEAVFGLAAQQVDGRPALVPSWLFQVKAESGATRSPSRARPWSRST
ncbi:hypothetical protein ACFQ60_16445 [Streptomyces zhihengii]